MKAINIFFLIFYSFKVLTCRENPFFYRCGYDEEKKVPLPIAPNIQSKKDSRRLDDEDEEFGNFTIYVDSLNIISESEQKNLEKYKDLFINSLNNAARTLEKLLKVKKTEKGYKCNDDKITDFYIKNWNKTMIGTNAISDSKSLGIDLFIFGRFDKELDDSIIASASIIDWDKDGNRPIMGVVIINPNIDYSKINSQEYFQSIMLHELTHILGFNGPYFQYFIHNFNKKDVNGTTRYYINSQRVLTVAKKYYNCSDIDGVELEYSGDSEIRGSHWKTKILLGEYMNEVIYPEEQVISEFTLALLEDTGYYKANYYTGGLMRYGKGKGCDFIKKRCVNSNHEINPKFENEFYDSISSPYGIEASCSSGRQSRTYKFFWNYTNIPKNYRYFNDSHIGGFSPADFCPVAMEYPEENINSYYTGHCSTKGNGGYGTKILGYDPFTNGELTSITNETYSDHSFCYQSTLVKNDLDPFSIFTEVRAICYESFCSSKSLTIKINDDYIVCPRAGGKIEVEGYKGFFLCPDYNLICSGTIMCNDMFDCVDKKSEAKEDTYIYDYDTKTSQNLYNISNMPPDNKNNYELGNDGLCTINCSHCNVNKNCIKCRNGYGRMYSKKNPHLICKTLEELNIGYYEEYGIFYPCMKNCIECSNNFSCTNCLPGLDFVNGKCVKQIENCQKYLNETFCLKCKENYAFKENNRSVCLNKDSFDNYYTEDGISYYPCENEIGHCSNCYYDQIQKKAKCYKCSPKFVFVSTNSLLNSFIFSINSFFSFVYIFLISLI